jgi:hypothetical protein
LATTLGPLVPIAGVSASGNAGDAARATDGDITTGWHAGIDQIGNEEFVIELAASAPVAALTFEMGAFAFGYPRDLVVDAEGADGQFVEVFRGPAALATVRAALERSDRVPVTIPFAPVTTRRLRLRQVGTSAGIPWWIPELQVHAPS